MDDEVILALFPFSNLPEDWQATDKHVQLFDVPKFSAEYKRVVYDILAREVDEIQKKPTVCRSAFVIMYEILRLQRIQNPALWASYRAYREAYRESKKEPNEIWAVHGSDKDSLDNISANGFNRSYNGKNATVYGKGAYFAKSTNFTYSCCPLYAAPDTDGIQSMILARVIEGKSTLGRSDMLEPPYIDAATKLRYDTTTDSNGTIIVTYKDQQAYPAYFITFKPWSRQFLQQQQQQQQAGATPAAALHAAHASTVAAVGMKR
jgi:hypothetical protein